MRSLRTSAPGKLILAGEHAVVYGRPAVVGAVTLRLSVLLDELDRRCVELRLPQLRHRETLAAGALRRYAGAARERWMRYQESPSRRRYRQLRGDDPAHVVKVALGEALLRHPEAQDPGWRLEIDSVLPVGSGMGSSAALAAALLAAVLRSLGEPASLEVLEALVLEVERRQHGSPSGIDGAIVLRGGVLWVERSDGRLLCREVEPARELLTRLRVLDTGAPGQTTGEVVAAVAQLRSRDPGGFSTALDRLEDAARRLRAALDAGDSRGLATAIRTAHRGLVALGVVPGAVARTVRTIEKLGGAAKISGAGALEGRSAGCLVVYHPEPESLARLVNAGYGEWLATTLGAEGVREES